MSDLDEIEINDAYAEALYSSIRTGLSVPDDFELTERTGLQRDLGADELDMIELLMLVEDILCREFDIHDWDDSKTIADLLKVIHD